MVATCFDMRSFTWRQGTRVLYLCACGTVGLYFSFWCAAGGIGSVSNVWGVHWGGRLGGFTLGGGAGAASGVSTLGDCVRFL